MARTSRSKATENANEQEEHSSSNNHVNEHTRETIGNNDNGSNNANKDSKSIRDGKTNAKSKLAKQVKNFNSNASTSANSRVYTAASSSSLQSLSSSVQASHTEMTNKPDPWARELDFSDYFYTPHTVFALLCIVITILFLLRYYYYPTRGLVSNVKLGLSASAFAFIAFGALHLPDSLLIRPHPALWRTGLACGIVYFMVITFMLFQDISTVHAIMGYYDSLLQNKLPEQAYAEDCRLFSSTAPFYLHLGGSADVFIIAHALGYVVKMLVLRDWRMVTAVSLGFEVIEVTLQHILPNFRECWWDHILLDVILCNGGGTVVGMWLLKLLHAKQYKWIALREIPSVKGKACRLLNQLGPRSFEHYSWNIFYSGKRFLQVFAIIALMLLQELNCFTLKSILNIPPKHHLVTGRLILWTVLATPGIREYYEYMNNRNVKRIGTTAWVTTFGLTLETIWIVKMMIEGNYFREEMPLYVVMPWMATITLFTIWLLLYFQCLSSATRQRKRGWLYHFTNLFFYAACVCIMALFLMGLPDLQIGRDQFEQFASPFAHKLLF